MKILCKHFEQSLTKIVTIQFPVEKTKKGNPSHFERKQKKKKGNEAPLRKGLFQ